MPVPRNVEIDRIDAEIAIAIERWIPEIPRNPVVEKCRGVNEKRLAGNVQFRIAAVNHDFRAARLFGYGFGLRRRRRILGARRQRKTESGNAPEQASEGGHHNGSAGGGGNVHSPEQAV